MRGGIILGAPARSRKGTVRSSAFRLHLRRLLLTVRRHPETSAVTDRVFSREGGGILVLRQILAALTAQSLSRIAGRPAEFWMKVKSRWRQNPGFVAAAAAGTIGIGLAIVLGTPGGLRLRDVLEPGDHLANDSSPALGGAAVRLDGGP